MLFRNIVRKYYSAAGEGCEGGGVEITPEIQAIIDTKVTESVTGLKTKNSELLGKLKEQGDNLKRYDGIDPDAVKTILQRFSDGEEAKPIAAGKIDEVLDKRTECLRADVDKKLKDAAPHLWPQASGTDAGAHKPSGAQLKRSTMTAVQKADYVGNHGQQACLKPPKD